MTDYNPSECPGCTAQTGGTRCSGCAPKRPAEGDLEHDERVFNLGYRAAKREILAHMKHMQERYPTDAGGHGRRLIEWVEALRS